MPDTDEGSTGITAPTQASGVPQFSTAEYAHIPGTERCRICNSLISNEYFRVNSQMACSICAAQAREGQPSDTHAAFARALLLGAGAAVLGLILYSTVVIVTGWSIGYLAIAVGWLIGKAMFKGSNGMGGLRYQIAAAALTYAAISMSAIPISISYYLKHDENHHAASSTPQDASSTADTPDSTAAQPQPASPEKSEKSSGLESALLTMALMGIASPFLELQDPAHGVIGLVILFVGMSFAFRMTAQKPLEVDGPYPVGA